MKVLISVDIEGITGVVATSHTTPGNQEYERFRKLMTADTNAAIEGALAGGADEVVVNDGHGPATNILLEELNPAATLISGSPKPFGPMQGISSDVDAVFFVGYHAAAGTSRAVMEHTWNGGKIFEVQLNGQVVGETGVHAALAGAYGAPVVLVTGDRAVTEEARALLGNIETVAVKDGVTRTAAQCLHPEVTSRYIREAAEGALKLDVSPLVMMKPIKGRIVFQRAVYSNMAELVLNSHRVDARTIEWTGEDMPTVYRVLLAMASD